MPSIGPIEIAVVLVIVLLLVGPKKLPGLARSAGSGIRGFKESLNFSAKPEELPPGPGQGPRSAEETRSGSTST